MFQYQSGTEGAAQYFSFLELIGFGKHFCTNVGTTIMRSKYFLLAFQFFFGFGEHFYTNSGTIIMGS